jgi:hypothetical protein
VCNCPGIMKNTLLALFAVIATASFTQAADIQSRVLPEFNVNADALKFIDQRLEAVVDEQIARTLSDPIPAKALAEANAMARPRIQFALSRDAMDIVLLTSNHS